MDYLINTWKKTFNPPMTMPSNNTILKHCLPTYDRVKSLLPDGVAYPPLTAPYNNTILKLWRFKNLLLDGIVKWRPRE